MQSYDFTFEPERAERAVEAARLISGWIEQTLALATENLDD